MCDFAYEMRRSIVELRIIFFRDCPVKYFLPFSVSPGGWLVRALECAETFCLRHRPSVGPSATIRA